MNYAEQILQVVDDLHPAPLYFEILAQDNVAKRK